MVQTLATEEKQPSPPHIAICRTELLESTPSPSVREEDPWEKNLGCNGHCPNGFMTPIAPMMNFLRVVVVDFFALVVVAVDLEGKQIDIWVQSHAFCFHLSPKAKDGEYSQKWRRAGTFQICPGNHFVHKNNYKPYKKIVKHMIFVVLWSMIDDQFYLEYRKLREHLQFRLLPCNTAFNM